MSGAAPWCRISASAILANRYGDCKDHVALYGALLDAVGIRNEPALISSGSIYTLPSVPGYGVINHVITWLPDLQHVRRLDGVECGIRFSAVDRYGPATAARGRGHAGTHTADRAMRASFGAIH